MLSGVGRLVRVGKYSLMLIIPADLVKDSTFPLAVGDEVQVTIVDGCKVMVQKLSSGRNSNIHNQ